MSDFDSLLQASNALKSSFWDGETFAFRHLSGRTFRGNAGDVAFAQISDVNLITALFQNATASETDESNFQEALDFAIDQPEIFEVLRQKFSKSGFAGGDIVQLILRCARDACFSGEYGKIHRYREKLKEIDPRTAMLLTQTLADLNDAYQEGIFGRNEIKQSDIIPFCIQNISARRFIEVGHLDRALLQLADLEPISPVLFFQSKDQIKIMITELSSEADLKKYRKEMKAVLGMADRLAECDNQFEMANG